MKGSEDMTFGSPVCIANVTASIKEFMDRCKRISTANGPILKGKLEAAVVAVWRTGGDDNVQFIGVSYR